MNKIIFVFFVLILTLGVVADENPDDFNYNDPGSLDFTNPNVDLNKVDWSKVSQAKVPVHRISELGADVIKIEEVSDKSQVTTIQWTHGSNLNKADDLSLYPNARSALSQKHPFLNVDVTLGHATYQDGVLTNGNGPSIDLTDTQFKGIGIKALQEGGFEISKRDSRGDFKIADVSITLHDDSKSSIQILPDNSFVLSSGSTLQNAKGVRIISLSDQTRVTNMPGSVNVEGNANLIDEKGTKALIGFNGGVGEITIQYEPRKYSTSRVAMRVQEVLFNVEGSEIQADNSLVIDQLIVQEIQRKESESPTRGPTTYCEGEFCFDSASIARIVDPNLYSIKVTENADSVVSRVGFFPDGRLAPSFGIRTQGDNTEVTIAGEIQGPNLETKTSITVESAGTQSSLFVVATPRQNTKETRFGARMGSEQSALITSFTPQGDIRARYQQELQGNVIASVHFQRNLDPKFDEIYDVPEELPDTRIMFTLDFARAFD